MSDRDGHVTEHSGFDRAVEIVAYVFAGLVLGSSLAMVILCHC